LFSKWLSEELKRQNMNQADLAKRANVSRAAISNLIKEKRFPGADLLMAIAKAFKLPPEQVFRRAGLFPPATPLQEMEEELAQIVKLLEDDERDGLVRYARLRLQVQDEKPKYRTARDTPPTPRK
jgi:transcriptional regulator with XRE-family HTH domain